MDHERRSWRASSLKGYGHIVPSCNYSWLWRNYPYRHACTHPDSHAFAGERPAAWVSLDQSDNDPALFWAYFIAALQTVQSGVGERALSSLYSAQPPALLLPGTR